MDNLEKFVINPTNEFHILRHFESVDNSYKKSLLNKPYWYYDYFQKEFISSHISNDDIEFALETIGTKFYSNIPEISNSKKLLELIREKLVELNIDNKICWVSDGKNKRFNFTFEYPAAVGGINVLAMSSLNSDNRKNIKTVARSKCKGENMIEVNTISEIELPSTNKIRVEVLETTQLPFYFVTAFPDCSSYSNTINNLQDEDIVFVV